MPANITIPGNEPLDAPSGPDQRSSNRLKFRHLHRIAPYAGGPVPAAEAFFSVPFFDISQGGFSYLADAIPAFDSLVVAMQIHSETIYVQARIVHHRQSGSQHIIGCRFEEKLPGDA